MSQWAMASRCDATDLRAITTASAQLGRAPLAWARRTS